MERILSPEERIRRAEEIYYQRKKNQGGVRVTSASIPMPKQKNNYTLFKKMALQILICLVLYFIFYLIQNTNYIFSENVMDKTKQILSYDMNLGNLYEQAKGYLVQAKGYIEGKNTQGNETQNSEQTKESENGAGTVENQTNEENIGGASQEGDDTKSEPVLSQMEIDANEIKTKYSLVRPVEGSISSRFGLRNPTTPTVPKNHTGIDIAANTGTIIRAALEGTVELASSEGDYRKSFKDCER